MDHVSQLVVFAFLGVLVYWLLSRRGSGLPLPPGPKKFPLIGNMLDIPLEHQWLAFSKMAKELGGSSLYNIYWDHELFSCRH